MSASGQRDRLKQVVRDDLHAIQFRGTRDRSVLSDAGPLNTIVKAKGSEAIDNEIDVSAGEKEIED